MSDAGSGSRILRLRRTILLLFGEKNLKTVCSNKALWHMAEVFGSQGVALSLTQFRWTDYRQPNSHCRPFADFALHVDFTAVQLDAALDDHQTKTRA